MEVVLKTKGLSKYFGSVPAADDISTQFSRGEIVGIIGPNGAGKTTFVNLVTGYVKPEQGHIYYQGQDITGHLPREITKLGITRSFQTPQLYTDLTALENVLIALAAKSGHNYSFWSPLKTQSRIEKALSLLDQFQLGTYKKRSTSELPEGDRKLLDIVMSFAFQPNLLLLDEPTSGVSTSDKFGVMDTLIGVLKRSRVTTLFIEHDMEVVKEYAERVLFFNKGKVVGDGDPKKLLTDKAYQRRMRGPS